MNNVVNFGMSSTSAFDDPAGWNYLILRAQKHIIVGIILGVIPTMMCICAFGMARGVIGSFLSQTYEVL